MSSPLKLLASVVAQDVSALGGHLISIGLAGVLGVQRLDSTISRELYYLRCKYLTARWQDTRSHARLDDTLSSMHS